MPNVGGRGKNRAWPSGNEVANSGIALAKRSPYNRPVPNGVPETETHPTQLLRRSLANGRLGHAYLFVGGDIESLESHAVELARTLMQRGDIRADGQVEDDRDFDRSDSELVVNKPKEPLTG